MQKISWSWICRWLTALGLVGLSACGGPSVTFSPDESGTQPMTPQEARKVLAKFVHAEPSAATCNECRVTAVRTTLSTIDIRWVGFPDGSGTKLRLPLTQLGHLYCQGRDKGIYVTGYLECRADNGKNVRINWTQATTGLPNRLASAIHALQQEAERFASAEEETRFQQALAQYRATGSKPQSPRGDVNRLLDEAQAAVKARDFLGATELYLQAGEMSPAWPACHFNAALVLGEMGDYEFAMREMNRYLALVPGAPNAHAAQQRIYEWEHKASEQI